MNAYKRVTTNLLAAFALTVLAVAPLQAATYFYHTDHLGTPQALTDENQQVVWQGEQDPFGENSPSVVSIEQNLRFLGQYFDKETELQYNYYRNYDATIGRYTQSDPIGLSGGLNTYGYAMQNPSKYIDFFGLDVWVYNWPTGGRGYGHTGLTVPNGDGTYTRYSQGADDPNASPIDLIIWRQAAIVNTKIVNDQCPQDSECVKIPTANNDQITEAIKKYVSADWPYNAVTNNCADFVNDNINAADDVSVWGNTIPNDYFKKLKEKYETPKKKDPSSPIKE